MKYTKDKKFIGQMFDEISPTYDKLNHLLSGYQDNRWRKAAAKQLALINPVNENIIDLASGSGDLAVEFIKLSPEKLYSVDLSQEMLKINRDKLPLTINKQVRAEAENLPFKNNYFDLCGISFGVRNFEKLNLSLKEINRILKPGGRFLTIEMFKPPEKNLKNRIIKLYFEKFLPKLGNSLAGSKYAYDYLFESVDNFLSVEKYGNILSENNFKIIHIKNNFFGLVYSVFAEKC